MMPKTLLLIKKSVPLHVIMHITEIAYRNYE